jgi:hypothetical protein
MEPSGADKTQYLIFLDNFFRAFENVFIRWQDGGLVPKQLDGTRFMVTGNDQIPAVLAYWSNRMPWYSVDFQSFMGAEILQAEAKAGVSQQGEHCPAAPGTKLP